jgi:protein-tyrosine phosphatase
MARPRAGDWLDDEVSGWRMEGIDIVVSLLEPEEVSELGLQREAHLCEVHVMEFISFPIPDRGVPGSLGEAAALARLLALRISEGKAVAVHCRAGIGRSSLIAACALACVGTSPNAAFELIGKARGLRVPDTDGQRDWVVAFQERLQWQPDEGWGSWT